MGRPNRSDSLDKLIDQLAIQIGKTALHLEGEDKFNDKLDALKALTTLKGIKAKTQQEPEGGGIDEFSRFFSSDRGVDGSPRDAEPADDDDYEPTETDHIDDGVSGDLTGLGGEGAGPDPAVERDHDRINGGE